jgi:sugar lactone lactonase YvrE
MPQRIDRGRASMAVVGLVVAALSGPVQGQDTAAPAPATTPQPESTVAEREAEGLRYPLGVAVAPDGGLVVADRLLPGLWRVADGRASILAAGTKRFRTPLNAVRAVAVAPDGTVFAGDSATREIYRIAADGTPEPLTAGAIGIPVDIAIDSRGRLFVSDLETQRVWRIDPDTPTAPVEVATLVGPRGLFVDADDRLWVVAASGEAPLVRVGGDGAVEAVVRTRPFGFPHDVVVDADGVAYVSDNYGHCVWRVPPGGEPERWAEGAPLVGPVGLALRDGRVVVADPGARQVFALDAAGAAEALVGGGRAEGPVP